MYQLSSICIEISCYGRQEATQTSYGLPTAGEIRRDHEEGESEGLLYSTWTRVEETRRVGALRIAIRIMSVEIERVEIHVRRKPRRQRERGVLVMAEEMEAAHGGRPGVSLLHG